MAANSIDSNECTGANLSCCGPQLSDLPDALLSEISGFLPRREATAFAVLLATSEGGVSSTQECILDVLGLLQWDFLDVLCISKRVTGVGFDGPRRHTMSVSPKVEDVLDEASMKRRRGAAGRRVESLQLIPVP
ncbi:hypothetical protein ACHAXT_009980 [Thalassiosira profunda]